MVSLKKLAGQTAIYGGSYMLSRFLNYLLVPLHTYIFQTGEYGEVSYLYAMSSLFIVLLTYGMETAYFRYSGEEQYRHATLPTVAISYACTSLLFVAVAFCFATRFAGWLHCPQHPEYVRWFALIIGADAFSAIFFASLRQQKRPLRFAFVKNFNILVNILFNLFFLLLCPFLQQQGIENAFLSYIYHSEIGVGYIFIANLIASLLTLVLLIPECFKTPVVFDFKLWKKMIRYALPLLVFGLAGIVNETMDRVMLRELLPPDIAEAHVGIYSACYKIAILMTLFIQAFKYAAEPFFFDQSKNTDARQTYADVMSAFVLICSFLFLGIMMYISIIKHFVGVNFRVGLPIVPILLLANLCLGIYYNLSIWYKLTDKTRMGAYISLFGACITIVFNYLLIPRLGYMGSAWATLVCYGGMMILSYFIGQKYYKVPYQKFRISGYIFLALLLYGLSLLVPVHETWIRLTVNTLFLLSYVIIIVWTDKSYLSRLLHK
ncbi:MAG: oligosaccharide flippase family protein [Bacteroidales bacterium]|jgi:O-antigen/teichoic acid export membrane protein|nr:oligosaccharide flippase family protein [Bacteroidales bacterium]